MSVNKNSKNSQNMQKIFLRPVVLITFLDNKKSPMPPKSIALVIRMMYGRLEIMPTSFNSYFNTRLKNIGADVKMK
jgi:hypothetical protein